MNEQGESSPSKSVERIAVLLEELSQSGAMGVRELARKLGWSKSIVHRLISSLENVGYTVQDPETGKYRLTVRLFELGSRALRDYGVGMETRRMAQEIVEETHETVLLAVRDGADVVYIERVISPQVIQIGHEIGRRSPARSTSAGKVLLAELPPEELRRLAGPEPYPAFTPRTLTTYQELVSELTAVRERGFATDCEERYPGVRAVAAPIRNYTGQAIMALVILAPAFRLSEEELPRLGRYAVTKAGEISRSLGYVETMRGATP